MTSEASLLSHTKTVDFDTLCLDGVDCIALLGGGRVVDEETPPDQVVLRCEAALKIYRQSECSIPIVCLSYGTVHKPNYVNAEGRAIAESESSANWLAARGVKKVHLLREHSSFDTIGNAFFLRTCFCEPRMWKRVVLITSEFHMPRTKLIFAWVFGLVPSSMDSFEFLCLATKNTDESQDYDARKMREERSRSRVHANAERLREMAAFHSWLFTEHDAYAMRLKPGELDPASEAELSFY